MDFSAVRPETVSGAAAAAGRGDLEALQQLVLAEAEDVAVAGGATWRAVDNRGWGPLHHAAAAGQVECVRLLGSEAGLDLDQRTWEGETPLLLAVRALPAARPAVHALLKLGASPNVNTNEQCSSLQYAAVKTDLTVVRWLVRRGARVGHSNVWGETALHTTMRRAGPETADRLGIVRYLLKHGARAVCRDENGLTPLMLAAKRGFSRICSLLMAECGDPGRAAGQADLRAEDGATALMLAAQAGQQETAATLLAAGADPDLQADDGTMAVHLACAAPHNSCSVLELLLPVTSASAVRAACSPSAPDPLPRTTPPIRPLNPYQLAVDWENWDSVDLLATSLSPSLFHSSLPACLLHGEICPNGPPCTALPYSLVSPAALLLQSRLTERSLACLPALLAGAGEPPHPLAVPPLLALLTSPAAQDYTDDSFGPAGLAGTALDLLVEAGQAELLPHHLLPVLLHGSVSALFQLVRSGLLAPHSITDPRYLDQTRQLLDRDFAEMLGGIFQQPLLTQRLLGAGILATRLSLLQSDWVQNLAILVLDQLKTVLSIDNLTVIDKMYKNLRRPKKLQELSRNSIHKALRANPIETLPKLNLPKQIHDYMLFCDVNVDDMIKDYKETVEYINNNGVSNVVHV